MVMLPMTLETPNPPNYGKKEAWLRHMTNFYRATAMLSAVYAVVVCLSVCLSHSGIVSKRLNVGSRKQRRTIAP